MRYSKVFRFCGSRDSARHHRRESQGRERDVAFAIYRGKLPNRATRERERVKPRPRKGIPIGNLTSQLFANIYMNEFDQFVKHNLRVKHYFRYTDDFVVVAQSREYLEQLLPHISEFLETKLALRLHPKKIFTRPLYQGIDFLGYVVFPKHRLLRTKTKRRIFKNLKRRMEECHRGKINKFTLEQSLQSYLGVLSHADSYAISEHVKNQFWFEYK